jgi:DNA-binding transcriptional MerR regulator
VPAQELSIGQLAARSGCKIPTIRYYEDIGLLEPAPRTDGGHRTYGRDAVMRLVFIRRGRELGFSLDEIRSLIDLSTDYDRSCAEIDAIATGHLEAILERIDALSAMRDALREVLEQCQRTTVIECRVIEALSPGAT